MHNDFVGLSIPYGNSELKARLPSANMGALGKPRLLDRLKNEVDEIHDAIESGLEATGVTSLLAPGSSVAIAITDRTRDTPNDKLLPILLDILNSRGIRDDKVVVITGTGMHGRDSPADLRRNPGPAVMERVEVISHDSDEDPFSTCGETDMGTKLQINRRFAAADIRLATGNIALCTLAGWTGGAKTVLPGVSSRTTIYTHHRRHIVEELPKVQRGSCAGLLPPNNASREDIEEGALMAGLQMVVNTVLNPNGDIAVVVAGDPVTSHREGVRKLRQANEIVFPGRSDILIAGVGSPGFEVSLYQGASRALQCADVVLRPGGTAIVVGRCREGLYEGKETDKFTALLRELPSPHDIVTLTRDQLLPPEEAPVLYVFSWMVHEMGCDVKVVTTDLDPSELEGSDLEVYPSLQDAVDDALQSHGSSASVHVLPYAANTLATVGN